MKRGSKKKGKYLSHRAIAHIKKLLDGHYLKHGYALARRKRRYHKKGFRKHRSAFNVKIF